MLARGRLEDNLWEDYLSSRIHIDLTPFIYFLFSMYFFSYALLLIFYFGAFLSYLHARALRQLCITILSFLHNILQGKGLANLSKKTRKKNQNQSTIKLVVW